MGFLSSGKLMLDVIGHVNLRKTGFLGFILGGREGFGRIDQSICVRVCI